MWLLNASTLKLESFPSEAKVHGRYAILSHTWEDDEVTFQDVMSGNARQRKAYHKLKNTCGLAVQHGLSYCWIDTCCIDKTSSAELSEAINSMYRWYYEAKVCYVYLSDILGSGPDILIPSKSFLSKNPQASYVIPRWFTRGWTLQELLAPANLEFYNARWISIGNKDDRIDELTRLTGIDELALRDRNVIRDFSVAARMSWAARRMTSREEDRAYSLLGLFGISMPMLYGEGTGAFIRLQEEIVRVSDDHSIMAWHLHPRMNGPDYALWAPSPAYFAYRDEVISWSNEDDDETNEIQNVMQLSSRGLSIRLPVTENPVIGTIAILNCRHKHKRYRQICLNLVKSPHSSAYMVSRRYSVSDALDQYWTEENDLLDGAVMQDLVLLRDSPSRFATLNHSRWRRQIGLSGNSLFHNCYKVSTTPARLLISNETSSTLRIPVDNGEKPNVTTLLIKKGDGTLVASLYIYLQRWDITMIPCVSFEKLSDHDIERFNTESSSKERWRTGVSCSKSVKDGHLITAQIEPSPLGASAFSTLFLRAREITLAGITGNPRPRIEILSEQGFYEIKAFTNRDDDDGNSIVGRTGI